MAPCGLFSRPGGIFLIVFFAGHIGDFPVRIFSPQQMLSLETSAGLLVLIFYYGSSAFLKIYLFGGIVKILLFTCTASV